MSEVRLLYSPDRDHRPPSNGAPQGASKAALAARQNIADFLDASLIKPLHFDSHQQEKQLTDAIETMTPAERVYLEIEMQSRARQMYSFDYDPLGSV